MTEPEGPKPLSLDWLLDPVPAIGFVRSCWETEVLLVDRNDPFYFRDLPGLDEIDELITASASGSRRTMDDGRLVRTDRHGVLTQRPIALGGNGIPDIHDVYHAYAEGFSVVVHHLHRRSSAVAQLCRNLESTLHHRIGANLYLTPRNAQALAPHVDTHDVFILQLHGAKEWRVCPQKTDLPLAHAKPGPGEFRNPHEYRLEPGDTMYLPRGSAHEALTSTSSSLHLTIGIHVYRWVDLLMEELGALADESVELRTALPPGFLDGPLDTTRLQQLTRDLAPALADESLAQRAKVRLGAKLLTTGKAATKGHFRSLDAIANLNVDALVTRADGVQCRVHSTAVEAIIEFDTNFVSGPKVLEPALAFVAAHECFSVRELPGPLTGQDKLDLTRRLVAEGLLTCTDNR